MDCGDPADGISASLNPLESMNFFDEHGVITLLGLAIFPRITFLVASFATGGFFWWLGWVFTPHLLVAILSLPYWDSNPVLVIFAWIMAIAGTGGEGGVANRRTSQN
jgi:hypothetical protein